MVGLGLLHKVGKGVAHTAFAHLDGEIIGDPRPFRLDDLAIVELELVLALHGASVVLLKDGRGTLVVRVHELAVDAVKHLVLRANGVDNLAETNLLRFRVNGQIGLGKGNGRKQDSDE